MSGCLRWPNPSAEQKEQQTVNVPFPWAYASGPHHRWTNVDVTRTRSPLSIAGGWSQDRSHPIVDR